MFTKYIGKQVGLPTGFIGRCVTRFMNVLNHSQYQSVLEYMKDKEQKRVLDIGFGNGYVMHRLSTNKSLQIYGLELSGDMLKQVKNKYPFEGALWRLHQGSVEAMPYGDNYFDIQYTINTIYFWPSLSEGLKEIYRVSKQNGICMITFYTKAYLDRMPYTKEGFHKYEREEIIEALLQHGFQIEDEICVAKKGAYTIIAKKED